MFKKGDVVIYTADFFYSNYFTYGYTYEVLDFLEKNNLVLVKNDIGEEVYSPVIFFMRYVENEKL